LSEFAAHRRRAWTVFAALVVAYSASQFYRAAPTVIAPDLMHELSLGAETIGTVAGLFFLAFGLAQIPVGVLLDRFGPRRVMPGLLVVAVAGTVLFATAESALQLGVGRALQGLGCAAGLMGAMVVMGRWFPPEKFATLSGLILGLGSVGVLMAASPLAVASTAFGWRSVFLFAAALTALFAVLLYVIVRDAPPGHEERLTGTRESPRDILRGLGAVLRNRQLWRIIAMQLTIYPSVMSIAALWAGPYLADVHGLDTEARGAVLNLMFLALVAAPILFGPMDRIFNTRKRVVVTAVLLLSGTLLTLALLPHPSLWQVEVLFVIVALVSPGSLVLHAHARASLPEHLVGRGMTLQNSAAIGGIFILQSVSGVIVGAFETVGGAPPETAYRAVFGFLGLSLLASLAIYAGVRDIRPGEVARAA
jgi:sugar phosphate permease